MAVPKIDTMLVRFTFGGGGGNKSLDYALDQVPRVGDTVHISGYFSGVVREVAWYLSDSTTHRFVAVSLSSEDSR